MQFFEYAFKLYHIVISESCIIQYDYFDNIYILQLFFTHLKYVTIIIDVSEFQDADYHDE